MHDDREVEDARKILLCDFQGIEDLSLLCFTSPNIDKSSSSVSTGNKIELIITFRS